MTSRTQILCIVDNMAMRSSAMWGEHGLSFWIKTGDMLDASYPGLDFHLNHCTGEAAFVALTNAFGDRVHPCPVGTIMAF